MRYEILGETLPVVICYLESGEKMVTEGGGMSWMSPNMKMETTSNGGIGKIFGRAFSGEKMFQNVYTAQGGEGMIAFASCFPGSIKAFEIAPGQEMILQMFLTQYETMTADIDELQRRLRYRRVTTIDCLELIIAIERYEMLHEMERWIFQIMKIDEKCEFEKLFEKFDNEQKNKVKF